MAQVMEERRQQAEEEERLRNMRYFDSTTKSTFTQQDLTQNSVGKRVMKTQDGAHVVQEQRDEQLQVENGFLGRTQKQSDQRIESQVPRGDYTQTQPVTIYTESLKNKAVMMSANIGANPMSKTSGMTQPVQNTRAIQRFEGDVDFPNETRRQDF